MGEAHLFKLNFVAVRNMNKVKKMMISSLVALSVLKGFVNKAYSHKEKHYKYLDMK
jgi:hypothetical protein